LKKRQAKTGFPNRHLPFLERVIGNASHISKEKCATFATFKAEM
jgi:hypothetical protein